MSEFYINSKKNNIRWKKLDVSKIENISQDKKDISNSPKEMPVFLFNKTKYKFDRFT